MTAVEKIIAEINNELQTLESLHGKEIFGRKVGLAFAKRVAEQAKEMEKEQRGYSEEEVRLAYFQGEKDSYIKGGQTKEMENEFIQSLQQKHELNKSE